MKRLRQGILMLMRIPIASLLNSTVLLLFASRPARSYSTSQASSAAPDGAFFRLSTGVKEYDHAYEVALRELGSNRDERQGVYVAGAGWGNLWTRDSAYAIELAAGLIDPDFSAKTLLTCNGVVGWGLTATNNAAAKLLGNVSLESLVQEASEDGKPLGWLQDTCGHFGAWPTLSDAIVGTQGAWALYLVQGDKSFLQKAYAFTLTSLHRAELAVYDHGETGLFQGCSSFMESNSGYPQRFAWDGKLVGQTKALSTNLLHYNGYILGSRMAHELGHEAARDVLKRKAKLLRDNIRNQMWLEKDDQDDIGGYYSYVMDENNNLLPQMEGLGESFVLLAPEFEDDETRIQSMFENIQRTPNGIACLWPQFQHNWTSSSDTMGTHGVFNLYHNGRIWPFVQGYWAMAAAKHGRVDIFVEELQNLMKLSQAKPEKVKTDQATALDGNAFAVPTNVTDTFAEFYELDGSFLWSQRSQLWSDAGFLSMFFYGIFGLRFETNGIRFEPMKPPVLFARDRPIALRGIHYRNMTLDVVLRGSGTKVTSACLDETTSTSIPPFVDATLEGHHVLKIDLDDESRDGTPTTASSNKVKTEDDGAKQDGDGSSFSSFGLSVSEASYLVDGAFEKYVHRLGTGDYTYSSKEYAYLPLLGWFVCVLLVCRLLIAPRRSH